MISDSSLLFQLCPHFLWKREMGGAVAVQVADFSTTKLEGELARFPGPASMPGHDVTSPVICWLADCLLVIVDSK